MTDRKAPPTRLQAAAPRPRRGSPALGLVSGCLALSAFVRAADPSSAFAVEIPKLAATAAAEAEAPVEAPSVATQSDLGALLASLRERERQLDEREAKMEEKARIVEAAEAKLREQMARLESAEARLGELMRVADGAADRDIGKLVSAFQTMDGKRAGPIFENMDVAFAAGLLSRMEDEAAAAILGALSPEKAWAVTAHIAGQNARLPRE